MRAFERGGITVQARAVPTGRAYGYVVRCGPCGLEVASPPHEMPNRALAYLRGHRSVAPAPTNPNRVGGDGRPWQIISGNDANGGNVRPLVRCGDCRRDGA